MASETPEQRPHGILSATGDNEHGQLGIEPLNDEDCEDMKEFTTTFVHRELGCYPSEIVILYACSKSTVFLGTCAIISLGARNWNISLPLSLTPTLHDGFGNDEEMHGCLDLDGRLYTLYWEPGPDSLPRPDLAPHNFRTNWTPKIGHIAEAGNGKICVALHPDANDCKILQFNDFQTFKRWYEDPASGNTQWQGTTSSGVIQLVANKATFYCLRLDGKVMSWGAHCHESLGRSFLEGSFREHASGPEGAELPAYNADKPSVSNQIHRFKKLAAGGHMCAGLDWDHTLWYWGTVISDGGEDRTIGPLKRNSSQGLEHHEHFEIENSIQGEPPHGLRDVVDFGVGENHIAVVIRDGPTRVRGASLWVIGDNRNGQLGMGRDAPDWFEEWFKHPNDEEIQNVLCGPRSTFKADIVLDRMRHSD